MGGHQLGLGKLWGGALWRQKGALSVGVRVHSLQPQQREAREWFYLLPIYSVNAHWRALGDDTAGAVTRPGPAFGKLTDW